MRGFGRLASDRDILQRKDRLLCSAVLVQLLGQQIPTLTEGLSCQAARPHLLLNVIALATVSPCDERFRRVLGELWVDNWAS